MKKPHSKSEARRLEVMSEPKSTKTPQKFNSNIGKVYQAKDRARTFGLDPSVKMTLAAVTSENGVTYYEFSEVKGTKWPASLFFLVG